MTFIKQHGVRIAGWCYLAGNVLLFVAGASGGGWAQIVASVLFVVSGLAYARNHYRTGGGVGLVGMLFFVSTLPATTATLWMVVFVFPAQILNITEGVFKQNVRPLVSGLLIASRLPMLWATWGTPVMGVAILWLAGDIALGLSTKAK